VSVTLSGFEDKTQGDPLVYVRVLSCGGSGALGYATGPGGDPKGKLDDDMGPIEGIKISSGGGGYARYGRTAPTLSLGNASDEPAAVSIELEETEDSCGCPIWTLLQCQ
jgi:hypothetical protein